ncbi:MAG: efflux RND transporter periplasmic adaptor subunit [Ahrensia sp.]|nr:efflux RND transporter periplasmic adaptor subunit [Ahrensia sp.]
MQFKRLVAILAATVLGATAASAQQNQPPAVEVAQPLTRMIIDYDLYVGQFRAVQDVQIQARVSGYLQSIHFDEGALVKTGDLLFQIDPRPFEAELAQAEAGLQVAVAARGLAEANNQRAVQLLQRQVGSQADADTTQAELAQAVANIALAEAQVEAARLDLQFTRITSPIDGRVSATNLDIGNLVTTSSILTRIVSLDPIEFSFEASEAEYLKYARLAREGDRPSSRETANTVSVRLSFEDNWDRKGKMSFVDNSLDPNSGTIEGRALFENSDLFLTPGTYGRLRLPASGEYEAILIPDSAILSDQSRKIVYVLGDDNIVQERGIEPGDMFKNMRTIRAGLTKDDTIIIRGLQRARPGSPVEPTPGTLEIQDLR